jgi:PST family polysaccharide transporter
MILRRLKSLLRPTVWVTAERGFAEVFSLALFAVQARILGPTAFGLIAAVMVFISFWDAVPANAVADALVAVRRIDGRHFSTAATTMMAISLVFGAVVFGCAGLMADLFHDADLAGVMRAMAALPLLQALSIVPMATTMRANRFQATTLRTIVSLIAGGVVGLALALAGAGAWALVTQALVQRLIAAIVMWSAIRAPFRIAFSIPHFRELAGFAVPVLLSSLMNWGAGQLPRLFLGIYLGSLELGLFATASRFNATVKQIAMGPKAYVARIDLRRYATDPPALSQAVRRVFLQMSLIGFPMCFGGAAIVPSLFHAWLDARWYSAILPSQILLLACVPFVTLYGATAVLYALNLQRAEAGVATVLNLGIVAAMVIGVQFGLVATSIALALAPLLLTPLPILIMHRKGHLAVGDILLPQAPPLLASAVMGGAVMLLRMQLLRYQSDVTALPVLIAAGAVLYSLLIVALMPRQAMQIARQSFGFS